MVTNSTKFAPDDILACFRRLCAGAGRQGLIGLAPAEGVHLLTEQHGYLKERLRSLGSPDRFTAASLALLYHDHEMQAIPGRWTATRTGADGWNDYAGAYEEVNGALDHVAESLAARFGGIAEQPTLAGWVDKVGHVSEYSPHCISHRVFAEAAGLGWRGRHSLIVTPEAGPALRLATVFLPGSLVEAGVDLPGCGDCRACLEVCPILGKLGDHREGCRRRIDALGLDAEVCGICVRVCWEQVRARSVGGQPQRQLD